MCVCLCAGGGGCRTRSRATRRLAAFRHEPASFGDGAEGGRELAVQPGRRGCRYASSLTRLEPGTVRLDAKSVAAVARRVGA